MTPIRILIPGAPVSKGRPKFGRGTDLRIIKRYSLNPATHVTIIPVLTAAM